MRKISTGIIGLGNIGYSYDHGRGVEVDEKKAEHYYELSAMAGDATAAVPAV